jgi:uncharacterized membrane protein
MEVKMMFGFNWSGFGMHYAIIIAGLFFLFMICMIVMCLFFCRWFRRNGSIRSMCRPWGSDTGRADDILKVRLAKGEISIDEYNKLRDVVR